MTLRNAFEALATESSLAKLVALVRKDSSDRSVAMLGGLDLTDTVRPVRTDPVGRLKISHAQPDIISADLVAINDALILNMDSLSDAMFFVRGAAHAGYVVGFEYSPDTTATPGYRPAATPADGNWFPVLMKNVAAAGSTATNTGTITSNSSASYELSAPAAVAVRARVTARTSGTLTVSGTGSTAARPTSVGVGGSVSISAVTAGTGASNLGKAEDASHSSADVGVMALGVRAPATPVAPTSAAGDYGYLLLDYEGKLITAGSAEPGATFSSLTTITNSTASTAARAAQASPLRTYVTDVTIANSSMTAVLVTILDGTTALWSGVVMGSGTLTKEFRTPLRGTAATALNVQVGAALTESVRISLGGYSGI